MNKPAKIEEGNPLALLRQPFPANQISTLPKPYKKDSPKGKCNECGGYHGLPAVHLSYVGHAALTDRLLDTDPEWSWEPAGFDERGLPARDQNGGLWIKLTVCGVTRYGYGAADGKSGGDAVKEIIGDALRNAAMRFGAALDLWHKGDLHVEDEQGDPTTGELPPKPRQALNGPYKSPTALQTAIKAFVATMDKMTDLGELSAFMATPEVVELEKQALRDLPAWWETGDGMPNEFEPVASRIHRKKRALEEAENIHGTNILHAG